MKTGLVKNNENFLKKLKREWNYGKWAQIGLKITENVYKLEHKKTEQKTLKSAVKADYFHAWKFQALSAVAGITTL